MSDGGISEKKNPNGKWELELFNHIDETVDFPTPEPTQNVSIDLGAVSYINSYGIRKWVQWLEVLEQKAPNAVIEISKVPFSFIRAYSLIKEIFPQGIRIKSFFTNYFCPECDEETEMLVDNSTNNVKIPTPSCQKCNEPLEPELPAEIYESLFTKQ